MELLGGWATHSHTCTSPAHPLSPLERSWAIADWTEATLFQPPEEDRSPFSVRATLPETQGTPVGHLQQFHKEDDGLGIQQPHGQSHGADH